MKWGLLFFVFTFSIFHGSFSQRVQSLHPLFTEHDAVLLPEVEGEWLIADFNEPLSFHKTGDNFYQLSYGNKDNPSMFEAVFVKVGDQLFLDLNGILPDNLGDNEYRGSLIKSHTLYKVNFKKDSLWVASLDYNWFHEAAKNRFPFRFEWLDNMMLLTSGTSELRQFFSEHQHEKSFCKQYDLLISKRHLIKVNTTESINQKLVPKVFRQKCEPAFPFNDGWLGGDGEVSICLNDTQALFIFSDSYVAAKEQQARGPGMGMVSNSVGVSTCLTDGGTEIHYYWNNMYAQNPEPIFKSFTNRYQYWVQDGFLINGYLYVLLNKIGPKSGASPNDLFSFTQLGSTLAKISNPTDRPDQWRIELIPLPDLCDPILQIQTHVIKDDYLYWFINWDNRKQSLVRKKLSLLDNPEASFEYYTSGKSWKSEFKAIDMNVLIDGFRPVTVNYHPEMKKWLMICDIQFMDNKIKIRTADEITGPWSEEKIIYEIPEVTPGNALYSKNNFCYLPRECFQNYDEKTRTLLITYDINNTDFQEINANPKIYTPKVIKVSLKK